MTHSTHAISPDMLPPEFDPAIYHDLNSDLWILQPDELRAHYREAGMAEGRRAHSLQTREQFRDLAAAAPRILELGLPGERIFDRENIVRFSRSLPADARDAHYAAPNGDLSTIGARFDVVASSHLIVREPDLLRHLDQVAALLHPGGIYLLFIPDKRFCLDHFVPESSIADVVAAALDRATTHSARTLIRQQCLTTHNDSLRHWAGDHGRPLHLDAGSVESALDLLAASLDQQAFVDRNAWQFTPDSFRVTIALLHDLGLTAFRPTRVYPTLRGGNEFWAVLSR